MKIVFAIILQLCLMGSLFCQRTISFNSYDGLKITADLYESKPEDPYVVLFHQARYSRGEYKETADRFVKLGYNCLAVDLRSGGEVNFVTNQTAAAAQLKGLPTNYIDSKPDMQASIEYAYAKSKKKVVLIGSSYSASLALLFANENPHVEAVAVFSPGEYFEKENFVKESIQGLHKPIFAAATVAEYPHMKVLLNEISPANLTLFKPSKGKGVHGSSALWKSNASSDEYWLSLVLFFNQIKE